MEDQRALQPASPYLPCDDTLVGTTIDRLAHWVPSEKRRFVSPPLSMPLCRVYDAARNLSTQPTQPPAGPSARRHHTGVAGAIGRRITGWRPRKHGRERRRHSPGSPTGRVDVTTVAQFCNGLHMQNAPLWPRRPQLINHRPHVGTPLVRVPRLKADDVLGNPRTACVVSQQARAPSYEPNGCDGNGRAATVAGDNDRDFTGRVPRPLIHRHRPTVRQRPGHRRRIVIIRHTELQLDANPGTGQYVAGELPHQRSNREHDTEQRNREGCIHRKESYRPVRPIDSGRRSPVGHS